MILSQIVVPQIDSDIQLIALITVCFTQIALAGISLWSVSLQKKLFAKQDDLHHEMNSMKDALVAKTASASHAEGMIAGREAERSREKTNLPQDG